MISVGALTPILVCFHKLEITPPSNFNQSCDGTLLIRRDPKPIDPKHWIETLKVLDLVVPGIDRHTAANGATTPPANKPVLPLSLRPTLLAGVATVARSGPKIIAELHGRTIGAHHAHFGAIAAGIVASSRPDT